MMRLARWALVLALTAGAAGCGGGSSPLASACDGFSDLLATSHPSTSIQGSWELVLVHPDGTGTEVVTEPDVVATDPTFSPQGDRLAFVLADGVYEANSPTATHLAMLGVDGKHQVQITGGRGDRADVFDGQPDWSPTGDVIAFTRQEALATPDPSGARSMLRLHVVTPGGIPRLLLGNAIDDQDRSPSWSPDGKQLAFVRTSGAWGRKPTVSIWVVDADGMHPRQVAALPDRPPVPLGIAWSPDGQQLLVGGGSVTTVAPLRSVGVADGAVNVVAPTGAYLVWSQDGTRLYGFTRGTPTSAGAWYLTTVRMHEGVLTDVHQTAFALTSNVDGLDVAACTK